MSISMYFGVSWLDPRLNINDSAVEWREVKTGPKDVRFKTFLTFLDFLDQISREKFLGLKFLVSREKPRNVHL